MWLLQELSKNPTQLGHLWSSSSLLNLAILTPCCLLTAGHSSLLRVFYLTASCLRLGWPILHPGLDYFVSFTWLSFVLAAPLLPISQVHAGSALCAKIWHCLKDAEDNNLSNSGSHLQCTYTHIYISCPLSPLKFYVFVGDSSGQPSSDRFYHRIGTAVQFCLQWHYLGAR